MSDQDVFNSKPKGEEESSAPAANPFDDLLKEIKTDAGEPKYDSVDKALEALKHSQEYIAKLEAENKSAKERAEASAQELSKMKTIEEFTSSLKPDTPTKTPEATTEGADKGVKTEDVEKLLEQKLAQRDAEQTRANNLNSVVSTLTKTYGDKTADHIKQVANDLGTTPEKLKDLSAENPKLALSLLGSNSSKSVTTPTKPSINSPLQTSEDNPKPNFEVGAGRGGLTDKQLLDRWRQVGEYTNKRIGVE